MPIGRLRSFLHTNFNLIVICVFTYFWINLLFILIFKPHIIELLRPEGRSSSITTLRVSHLDRLILIPLVFIPFFILANFAFPARGDHFRVSLGSAGFIGSPHVFPTVRTNWFYCLSPAFLSPFRLFCHTHNRQFKYL